MVSATELGQQADMQLVQKDNILSIVQSDEQRKRDSIQDRINLMESSPIEEILRRNMVEVEGNEVMNASLDESAKVILSRVPTPESVNAILSRTSPNEVPEIDVSLTMIVVKGKPTDDPTVPFGLTNKSFRSLVRVTMDEEGVARVSFYQPGRRARDNRWVDLSEYTETVGEVADMSPLSFAVPPRDSIEKEVHEDALENRIRMAIALANERRFGPLPESPPYVPDTRDFKVVPSESVSEPSQPTVEIALDNMQPTHGIRVAHASEPRAVKIKVSTTDSDGQIIWVDMGTHTPSRKIEGPSRVAIYDPQFVEDPKVVRARMAVVHKAVPLPLEATNYIQLDGYLDAAQKEGVKLSGELLVGLALDILERELNALPPEEGEIVYPYVKNTQIHDQGPEPRLAAQVGIGRRKRGEPHATGHPVVEVQSIGEGKGKVRVSTRFYDRFGLVDPSHSRGKWESLIDDSPLGFVDETLDLTLFPTLGKPKEKKTQEDTQREKDQWDAVKNQAEIAVEKAYEKIHQFQTTVPDEELVQMDLFPPTSYEHETSNSAISNNTNGNGHAEEFPKGELLFFAPKVLITANGHT